MIPSFWSGYRIDIGVVDPTEPGRFLLGVECDGATYHSAATARDRDRLREQVLRNLDWRIHRIWSPDWVTKREAEIRRLKQAIEEARQARLNFSELDSTIPDGYPSSIEEQGGTVVRVPVSQPGADEPIPGTTPYKVWNLHPTWVESEFYLPEHQEARCRLLAKIVREEGPIHIRLAARRLVTAWGVSRTGPRIMVLVQEASTLCERRGLLTKRGPFLWPPELADVPVRIPVDSVPESLRDIEYIPPEEIHAAMLLIVHHAVGIGIESLIIETARLFGFTRTGERIRERLFKEYQNLLESGVMKQNDNSVTL